MGTGYLLTGQARTDAEWHLRNLRTEHEYIIVARNHALSHTRGEERRRLKDTYYGPRVAEIVAEVARLSGALNEHYAPDGVPCSCEAESGRYGLGCGQHPDAT